MAVPRFFYLLTGRRPISPETQYRLELWRYGFIGRQAVDPFRAIQALLCHRATDAAPSTQAILCSIRKRLKEIGGSGRGTGTPPP